MLNVFQPVPLHCHLPFPLHLSPLTCLFSPTHIAHPPALSSPATSLVLRQLMRCSCLRSALGACRPSQH
jgi:hypothetical protein